MAASMVAVEMLKLLLLLLEDAKSSWDSESPCASFTGESFFLVPWERRGKCGVMRI